MSYENDDSEDQDRRNYSNTPQYKTASGRTLGVFKVANSSLFEVGIVEDRTPYERIPGRWTAASKAMEAIAGYCTARDATAAKAAAEEEARRAEIVAVVAEQDALKEAKERNMVRTNRKEQTVTTG